MKAVCEEDRDLTVDPLILPKGKAFCDNMGVVKHDGAPNKPLSEEQAQADILGHMKYLLHNLSAQVKFSQVKGQVDKVLGTSQRTLQQNIQVLFFL